MMPVEASKSWVLDQSPICVPVEARCRGLHTRLVFGDCEYFMIVNFAKRLNKCYNQIRITDCASLSMRFYSSDS